MIKRTILCLLGLALSADAFAAAQKPLVIVGGQIRQQQAGDTFTPNQLNLPTPANVGLAPGPTSPTAGTALQMDWNWNNGSNAASSFGWLWGTVNGYGGVGVARSFGSTLGAAGSPLAALWTTATNTGTPGDTIGAMTIAYAKSSAGENFGGNDIVTSDNSLGTLTLIGREIDLQPGGTGNTMSGASNGLILNMWTLTNPASAVSVNVASGGKWAYGYQCASGAVTYACLIAPSGTTNGIELQGSSGHANAGSIYNSADYVTVNSGANGFAIKDQTGVTNRMLISSGYVLLGVALQLPKFATASLPTCNAGAEGTLAAVSDANSATFNAAVVGGGANHVMAYCNGTGWTVH